jgi:galactose mutarotase-like enzyme
MMTIDWHGFEGWVLENEALRVCIVPSLGAKIASLYDKAAGYEWLAPPSHPVRERAYGDTFVAHDMAGWDEMFPTIVPCASPFDPAVELPDHGEVWLLPWHIREANRTRLTLSVTGQALPYVLTRTASLHGDRLRLDYHLKSHAALPLPFLWTAHPLFNADEHTRIELPPSLTQVVNASAHLHWGQPDHLLEYPGLERRLDAAGNASLKDYRKFYLPPEQVVSSTGLVQQDRNCGLRLRWDSAFAPYLGVWVDEGTYSKNTTVALEPASGYRDSLSLAIENKRVSIVQPGAEVHWWLEVACVAI